jgi:hypothetical protein
MTKRETFKTKQTESSAVRDLGNATEETKGYNFDYVQEVVPLDKRYNA